VVSFSISAILKINDVTMKYNIFILMILIILGSFNVISSSGWTSVGNSGYFDPSSEGFLWASIYPQGNYNFSSVTDAVSNEYQPLVYNPLYSAASISNYIYSFSSTSISAYDGSDFSLIDDMTFSAICGQPVMINLDSDSDVEIAVPVSDGADKYIYIIGMTPSGLFNTEKIIPISNTSLCNIDSDFPISSTYIASLSSTHVELVNVNTAATDYSWNHSNSYGSPLNYDSSYPYYSKPLELIDIDSDGTLDVFLASKTGVSITLKRFDNTGTLLSSGSATAGYAGTTTNMKVYPVNIGNPAGSKEIIVSMQYKQDIAGIKYSWHTVFSSACNKLFFSEIGHNYGGVTTDVPTSDIIVADINYDGSNEFCFRNKTSFDCFNSAYANILHINNTNINSLANYEYIAIGEYDNNLTYMEIITPDKLYTITGYNSVSTLYNFSVASESALVYPVTLRARINYTKDVLITSNNIMNSYFSQGDLSECGDGICSLGETIATCPADCITEDGTVDVGDFCKYNHECETNRCHYGTCDYKQYRADCEYDHECLSNDCDASGQCTKESLWQSIDTAKTINFGDDSNSSDLVCFGIILIVAIMLGVLLLSLIGTDMMMFLVIEILAITILVFFFSSVGWLSAIYAIIAIIVYVVGFLMFLMSGFNMSGR
jgi:hypothetical protein